MGGEAVLGGSASCAVNSLWKVGPMRPGRDPIQVREIDYDEALALSTRDDFTVDPGRMIAVM